MDRLLYHLGLRTHTLLDASAIVIQKAFRAHQAYKRHAVTRALRGPPSPTAARLREDAEEEWAHWQRLRRETKLLAQCYPHNHDHNDFVVVRTVR